MWEELWRKFIETDPILKIVAATIAALIFSVLAWVSTKIWKLLWPVVRGLASCCRRVAHARHSVREQGDGVWLATIGSPPSNYYSMSHTTKPIVTVANLKGGVGKTTLTANLAAYFANPHSDPTWTVRRVLAIDLDFQGSLSSMMFSGSNWQPGRQLSRASIAIGGNQSPAEFVRATQVFSQDGSPPFQIPHASGVSAFYDLARTENRVMIEWIIGDAARDIRYNLAELLHHDDVRNAFDIVLIDAPPRLTTACIQALCASTHVLIPTGADDLAADAVGYFGNQLKAHQDLWPHLKIAGIVGTMGRTTNHGDALKTAGDALWNEIEHAGTELRRRRDLVMNTTVPHRAALGQLAGKGIAYASPRRSAGAKAIRDMFDALGREVESRLL